MTETDRVTRMRELIGRSSLGTDEAKTLAARTPNEQVRRIRDKLAALNARGPSIQQRFDDLAKYIDALDAEFRKELNGRYVQLEKSIKKSWPDSSYTGAQWPRDGEGNPVEISALDAG